MREKIQRLSGAMMVPVILIVIAGLCIGIGAALSDPVNISKIGLSWLIPEGGLLQSIFSLITNVGFTIMRFLPVFFATALAFGLAKKERGWAAFSGLFFYLALNSTIGAILGLNGITADTATVEVFMSQGLTEYDALVQSSLYGHTLGIFGYNMSVFGGIISGLITSAVHNRYYKKELSNMFSFFAGVKFVPIVLTALLIPVGYIMYFVWPVIGQGLALLGSLIASSGLFGTFLFGAVDKALLPFGLHHLIAFPIEYTSVGGVLEVCGENVEGVRNIILAQAGCPEEAGFIVRNFRTGRILFQFGGFAGIGLAMYKTAFVENRKKVLALLVPAIATGMIIGVSEPLEYTFLFVAPLLYYVVYVPLAGLAYVLTEIFAISINGEAAIFMIPNLFQPDKVNAMPLLFLIPLYFAIYYFVFKWAILKWDIKTPGRTKASNEEIKLYSKKDYLDKKYNKDEEVSLEAKIIEAFGGEQNIDSVTNCATRLRVSVFDEKLVVPREVWMDSLEASGFVESGNAYQIIYGTRVTVLTTKIKEMLEEERNE